MKTRLGTWIVMILTCVSLGIVGTMISRADAVPARQPADLLDGRATADQLFGDVSAIRTSQTLTPTAYLPFVTRGSFVAFTYTDTFDDLGRGWPYGFSPYGYGYRTDGDGSTVYYIKVEDEYEMGFVTAPTFVAGDFTYEIWLRRADNMPKYWFDEYGVFLSPQPIDPQSRTGTGVYTLHIELKIDPTEDSSYAVAKWNTLNRDNRTFLAKAVETDYITDAAKVWNRMRITRTGDTLNFYVTRQGLSTWKLVHSLTDSSQPYMFYVGLYAQHSKDDLGAYEIEFQWDNLSVNASP